MNQLGLAVFDMAGTTVFDGDAVHTCLSVALAEDSVFRSRDEINAVMGWPKPDAIRTLLCDPSGDEDRIESRVNIIHNRFRAHMLEHYQYGELKEIEGATELFRMLTVNGITVSLDTGFDRQIANMILKRLGWLEMGLVQFVITSQDVRLGRPHPDMIFRAMELTGIKDASRIAKIGDTPSDLLEGTNAGCGKVIGVTYGSHTSTELEAYPHTHLVGSIKELGDLLLPEAAFRVKEAVAV